jgi:LysR family transcriptional activator of nhaA
MVVAELDDAALADIFGQAGIGVFAAPDVIESELRDRYKLQVVGRAKEIHQRFYAISVERKIRHPAVMAICDAARKHIFA